MAFVDWYVVLAIEPSADDAAVRKAYRRAALKYHPDKNPDDGAADQFDLLGQALAVLTDADRRAEFDRMRARRAAVAYSAAARSERLRELKAKLERPVSEVKVSHTSEEDVARLKQESLDHRRALDALLDQRSHAVPSVSCRTLADRSRTFPTVDEARAFVDTHAGARLQASWRPAEYSKGYEETTLARFARRARQI